MTSSEPSQWEQIDLPVLKMTVELFDQTTGMLRPYSFPGIEGVGNVGRV
jgi:hypothetical protein